MSSFFLSAFYGGFLFYDAYAIIFEHFHRRVYLFSFCLLFQSSILAFAFNGGYSPGYEPFPKAMKVKMIPGQKEDIQRSNSTVWKLPFPKNRFAKMTLSSGEEAILFFEYPTESQTFSLVNVQPFFNECWVTELNGDGKPDFVLVFTGTGCGLASEYTDVIFALSKKDGYVLRGLKSMGFGSEDIVDINCDGKPEIIHSELIYGGPGKDGKFHNYWVYTFFNIHETEFEKAKTFSQEWIQFKFRKNHIPTNQLTSQQKARFWNEQHEEFFFNIPIRK
ncbi:MAG: VCBS repeat-containing protein [Candidatus Riflebacteria bacterium]|nr:VCBS repeat-containing protein [Candidatus Riflebacteria bacterium]